MNPKKSKDFITEVANELNLDEALVKKATDFYWKAVRESLEKLDYPDIQIANFGRFVIKELTFKKKLDNHKAYIDNQDNLTFGKYYKYKKVEECYNNMVSLKKHIDERNEKKKSFKQNKNNTE